MTAQPKTVLTLRLPKPHAGQRQILRSSARFKVICAGRRFGKTSFIPSHRIKPLMNGAPVAYFAPTYKMMQSYWREVRMLLLPVIKHVSKQEHRLELLTGGSITMWSLDNPDAARGQKYAAADIDEAAMIPGLLDAFNAVIRPTLTDYRGSASFWSTPKGLNDFHKLHLRGVDPALEEWESFHFPTSTNPFIDAAEIEAARLELPADVFRQEYLAEFISGEGAVFRNIRACLTNAPTSPHDHIGHNIIAGVDWGQVNDFTAISIGCETCSREVELDRFNKIDWRFQRERLNLLFRKWNVSNAMVELNSIGSPNFEELSAMGLPVRGFTTTAQSKPPLIQNLALTLEQNEFMFIDDPVATGELEAYEAVRSQATGRIGYNAPKGGHDDTVIARALMNQLRNQGIGVYI